ncbi:MAG TPA: hypothetical protein VGK73_32220 [Polyangiaceae bacterium]
MSNDIKLAELENYIDQHRLGLHKIIDGTLGGIRARVCEALGPKLPTDDLPWRYETTPGQWYDIWNAKAESAVVSHACNPLPRPGTTVHLFANPKTALINTKEPLILMVKHARVILEEERAGEPSLVLLTFDFPAEAP